ncbi:MAG: amidohydrolase family protein [Catalinimonas sp.]
MRKFFSALLLLLCGTTLIAQPNRPRNGVRDVRGGLRAFTNATLFLDYQTRVEGATLVIRDGKVVAAGRDVSIPAGATVRDLKGSHVYPSLIDLYTDYGLPAVKPRARRRGPQMDSEKTEAYAWNQAIHPEMEAIEHYAPDSAAAAWRKMGFGAVLTHQPDGIARGTAALVSLHSPDEDMSAAPGGTVLKERAAAVYSFNKGTSPQDYPSSLMGSIALLRQTYLDARWYAEAGDVPRNLSLDAWRTQQSLPQLFVTDDKLDLLRADKLGDEFGVQYLIKTGGDAYQRLDAVRATGAPLIVTLDFPKPYDVTDPHDARMVSLAQLKHWEMAPANAARLAEAGVAFALTTADLKDKEQFWPHLRKAVRYGLSPAAALRALTETPARLLGVESRLGSLRPGRDASFLIASDSLLNEGTVLYENWVGGHRYVLSAMPDDPRGTWELAIGAAAPMKLEVTGQPEQPKAVLYPRANDSTQVPVTAQIGGDLVTLSFPLTPQGQRRVRLSGWRDAKTWRGEGEDSTGASVSWRATYVGPAPEDTAGSTQTSTPELGPMIYPFAAYGAQTLPGAGAVLIRNATVWTNEAEGVVENTDVLVRGGTIVGVGANLTADGARVVDGTGKHLTSGIIDEHSHIAISRGVNEGTQAVTAEVRIGDVVNSEDVNIYRHLAGGVTAAQLLHGSANPIGGQSALIKMRWGQLPEQMKIEGAPGFIKFALGENVKQSNWGDAQTERFPQTRMGVEQVFVDAFQRAKMYDAAQRQYADLARRTRERTPAPHRDLELEALREIMNDERFITCHSYIQSEINMLLHVADTMGFRVNTFTHILEGYKVADKMAAHGAGGSTFADWWAYKFEVKDAIPYNAALMHREGVLVAINSDDAEMGRRLNQEAAKTIKYGGLSEEEAWKLVTLNPAKLLRLDNRMGSIRAGKDADLVLWSDHPLSIYARPEQTYVDGVLLFDLARDQRLHQEMEAERQRIIQAMLREQAGGSPTQSARPSAGRLWDCEQVFDVWDAVNGHDEGH